MAKNQTFHVMPKDGAWIVRSGAGKKNVVFDSKKDAIDAARKQARSSAEVIIHGKSGQAIQKPVISSGLTEKAIRDAIRAVGKAVRKPAINSASQRSVLKTANAG